MQGVKVVLLPIQGDADLLLSFSEPRPTRSSATWLDESVGVKQFTLPASSEFFCGRKPSEDFEQGWQQRATLAAAAAVAEECKLHIGVSGFEEGDFKLFLYNYTQDAADAVAGGDMMDYDDFVATSCSPGCDDLRLGNAECDIACNTTECVWDGGDCGYDGGYGFEDLKARPRRRRRRRRRQRARPRARWVGPNHAKFLFTRTPARAEPKVLRGAARRRCAKIDSC
mmetsp:Transcript_2658/g.8158  ORF Transcript_2658/g.8158 Transcript_2658/m.8158 type:complete len:226 (-) Transcript_2658:981-1658(-)